MPSFNTKGTCSRQILFTVTDDIVTDIKFVGGCSGSLQGIARLSEGQNIDYLIKSLKGIRCRNSTSCPDQLAEALQDYKDKKANK